MPRSFAYLAVLVSACGLAPGAARAASPAYVVAPVTGVTYTGTLLLNRWGQVAGTGITGAAPVLWTPSIANGPTGKILNLSTQPGFPANAQPSFPGSVAAINDRGQVTGSAHVSSGGDANGTVTFLWTPKTLNSAAGVLHGGAGKVTAFAQVNAGSFALAPYPHSINNLGQISASGAYYVPELFTPTAANTGAGNWTFDSSISVSNFYINDAGTVGGSAYGGDFPDNGHNHAFEQASFPGFTNAALIVDANWQAMTNSAVLGLNAAGDAIISAEPTTDNEMHSFLDKGGVITDISGDESTPAAINNSDMVVGGHVVNGGEVAYVFGNGVRTDLPTVIPATVNGNGFVIDAFPAGLNDRGQILITGNDGAGDSVFLLTPAAQIIGKQPAVVNGVLHPAGAGQFKRTVTVKNTTSLPLSGTVSVAFDGLPAGVSIPASTAATQFAGPAGSPVVDVSFTDLAAGASAPAVTVVFTAPSAASIKYTARVLTSNAPR